MENNGLYSYIARKKIFKTLLIFICATFFSCENFMNGSALKQLIDEAVEYANSTPFNIRFSGIGGKISPSGEQSVKVSDEISLIFTEDTDKCFKKWEVLLDNEVLTDEDAALLVSFDELNSPETKIKILKKEANIKIQALVEKRPKVLNYSPGYKAEGVFRDSLLRIIFSQSMSESSIYWTKDELDDLGITEDKYELLLAKDKTDENGSQYYYGYSEKGNPENVIFKAILIVNRDNPDENLLRYYDCPFYADSRCTVLNIPTKKDKAPPQLTDIEFEIQKSFANSNGVELSEGYMNFYFTNSSIDTNVPIVKGLKIYDGNTQIEPKTNVEYSINGSLIKNLNKLSKNLKISVEGSVSDLESGPSKVKLELERVNTKFYDYVSVKPVSIEKSLEVTRPTIAELKKDDYCFDFGSNIIEGIYNLRVIFSDNNGNETTGTYVCVYDHTAPSPITNYYSSTRKGYIDLNFDEPATDFDCLQVSFGDNGTYEDRRSFTSTGSKHYAISFGNAVDKTRYYYGLRAVDYVGNVSSKVSISEVAGIVPGQIVHVPNNKLEQKFVSANCYNDKNPIGVVCEASELFSVKIWDIYEYKGYTWGATGKPCGDEQLRYEDYWIPSENKNRKINVSSGLDWLNLINSSFTSIRRDDSIWAFVNTRNASSPVTWYVPGVLEYIYLLDNYNSMKGAYTTLKNAGYDATLISAGQPYWTGVPRYVNSYAYVVEFKTKQNGCDWTLKTNSSSEMQSLYVTSSEREGGWYYKDKNYDTTNGVTYYLRTHTMANIDLR